MQQSTDLAECQAEAQGVKSKHRNTECKSILHVHMLRIRCSSQAGFDLRQSAENDEG